MPSIQTHVAVVRTDAELDAALAAPALLALGRDRTGVLVQIFAGCTDEAWIDRVRTAVATALPDAVVVGISSAGEIGGGRAWSGSTTIVVTAFSHTRLRMAFEVGDRGDEERIAFRAAETLREPDLRGVLVFATPLSLRIDDVVSSLYRSLGVKLFGGGAAGNGADDERSVFTHDRGTGRGLLCVGLYSDRLRITTDDNLGWKPLGPTMRATRTRHHGYTVDEIDGRPALDVYRHYLGGAIDEVTFSQCGVEFPVLLEQGGRTIARTPIAANPDGSIQFLARVPEGVDLRLGYGHVESILGVNDALAGRARDFVPEAVFLYSCVCRHAFLQDDVALEIEALDGLAPTAGFFTFGEIYTGPQGAVVLNSTLTLVALSEEPLPLRRDTTPRISPVVDSRQARMLRMVTHFLATVSSELNEKNAELQRLASTDALTGAVNRRALFTAAELEISRHRRSGSPLALLTFDLDHFKHINDTCGHAGGDRVLVEVTRIVRGVVRGNDTIARIGGEEFAVLLPDTDLLGAARVAERLREAIAEEVHAGGQHVHVSIGVSELHPDHPTLDALLAAADRALYVAKSRGRNRVEIARLAN